MTTHTDQTDQEGFLAGICGGRFRWDVVHPFPQQEAGDRATGVAVLAELDRFLRSHVDADEIDLAARLPDGLLDQLRRRGYLGLRVDRELGGLGLSHANAFRVIEAAMSWAVPVGWCLAIQNGLGAGAYLPLLPHGPLRDLIRRRVAGGAIFADADTEPSGASNELRSTTATLTADGSAYLVDGEKICIGNGPVADFLVVSATVDDADGERVEYLFLDTSTPGFGVRSAQQFLGLRGASIGALTFDRVRVPREQLLTLPDDVDTELEVNRPARMYIVSAPALAIAKLCRHWSRAFVLRRRIDGLPLSDYDEIQRIVADTLADTFAIESVVEWCLHGESREGPDDFRLEQSAAKNITSVACWRVVDRTVSLLAAEGLETSGSKAARGAQPLPVERALRDARALRIAGGVDFLLDKFFGETVVLSRVNDGSGRGQGERIQPPGALSRRNREHLGFVQSEIAAFPAACRDVLRRTPLPDRVAISMNRVANELLTMSVTLSRAASLAAAGEVDVQDLADLYCAAARHRLADWWRQARDTEEPDYGRAAARWLADRRPQPTPARVNEPVREKEKVQ